MNIFQIIAVGIISAILITLLKETKPELAIILGVAAGVIIVILVVDELYEIVASFYEIVEMTGIGGEIFTTVLKIIGIGYITEFAANICADAGCKSVGDKILFAAKVRINFKYPNYLVDFFLLVCVFLFLVDQIPLYNKALV